VPNCDQSDVVRGRSLTDESKHDPAANQVGSISRHDLTQSVEAGVKRLASPFNEAVGIHHQHGSWGEVNDRHRAL